MEGGSLKIPDSQIRSQSPVFVVGSARSGNTLLYHTLLSSGHFADYRSEPAVFDLIGLKFGNLARRRNRELLLKTWLRSKMYRVSGLEHNSIRAMVLDRCQSRGDFLRIVMGEVAHSQGLHRWAVWGPDNLLHMAAIKSEIPNALFIHVIRDGRDVAASMRREGWITPFPWNRKDGLLVAALHWKWKVEYGIKTAGQLGADYLEVRFEDLVANLEGTLALISRFIAHDLDVDQIRKRSVGTLASPNSTFREEVLNNRFQPIDRWRHTFLPGELKVLEASIGSLLRRLRYKTKEGGIDQLSFREWLARVTYPHYFNLKEWLRSNTYLGRLVSIERLHVTP